MVMGVMSGGVTVVRKSASTKVSVLSIRKVCQLRWNSHGGFVTMRVVRKIVRFSGKCETCTCGMRAVKKV